MPPQGRAPSFGLPEYHVATPRHSDSGLEMTKDFSKTYSVNDFRSIKPVGCGDMGSVYMVESRATHQIYAMKVMKKEVIAQRKNAQRVENEREILSTVEHPFLPTLVADFESDKHHFLVMNYCHGGDLNVLRQKQPEKIFSESAVRFYAAETLMALEYLHKRGIVYRDLKPENILIQGDGHVLLTDFDLSLDLEKRKGLSKTLGSENSVKEKDVVKHEVKRRHTGLKKFLACGAPTEMLCLGKNQSILSRQKSKISPGWGNLAHKNTGKEGLAFSFVGTEEYVAPEIVWGKGHSFPVDWWTLGVLMYELYYGKTPFKGANRKETFYNVLCKPVDFPGPTTPLVDLIKKLLVKEPDLRLGAVKGAEEIKKHPFFEGLQWDFLHLVTRAPIVPPPLSLEAIEKELEIRKSRMSKARQSLAQRQSDTRRTSGAQPRTSVQRDSARLGKIEINSRTTMSSVEESSGIQTISTFAPSAPEAQEVCMRPGVLEANVELNQGRNEEDSAHCTELTSSASVKHATVSDPKLRTMLRTLFTHDAEEKCVTAEETVDQKVFTAKEVRIQKQDDEFGDVF